MYNPYNSTDIVNLLSAILTPVIGVTAIVIAFWQWKTNNDKLKLDLFEKRYPIFKAFTKLFAKVVRNGRLIRDDLSEFYTDIHGHVLLFDSDVEDYVKLVTNKSNRLMYLDTMLRENGLPVGEERTKLATENSDLLGWFTEQFKVTEKLFKKYLWFKK